MQEFACPLCGSNKLEKRTDGTYFCVHCGGVFRDEFAEEQKAIIRTLFGEQIAKAKEEQIAKVRSNLWTATHEKYTDSDKIVGYARDLKNLLPDDFQANFYEVANGGNARELCAFLEEIDPEQSASYLPDALSFLIKSLEPGLVSAVKDLITRAYKGKEYIEYISKVEDEALKLDEGMYTSSLPRDVFLAYSSADMGRVNEVAELLEKQGFTCFVALRNLRHGRGAVQNYQKELETAIRNCKCVVFLSSENSRSLSCDALKLELPFIKAHCPEMGRVEYVTEEYGANTKRAAQTILKSFFEGLEWCRTEEDLIARVVEAVTKQPKKQDDLGQLQEELHRLQESVKSGDRNYVTLENYAKSEFTIKGTVLKKYKGKGGDVKIPQGVTEIGEYAFFEEYAEKHKMMRITIPEGVSKIGENAFGNCSGLTEISLPNGLMSIDKSAFNSCSGLKSITIPDGVTVIGDSLFKACGGLKSIVVPDTVVSIGGEAFNGCDQLTGFSIPDGVTEIGAFAFHGCNRINSITIPESVKKIGNEAFGLGRFATVYCRSQSQPTGWSKEWNCYRTMKKGLFGKNKIVFDKTKVVWGYSSF